MPQVATSDHILQRGLFGRNRLKSLAYKIHSSLPYNKEKRGRRGTRSTSQRRWGFRSYLASIPQPPRTLVEGRDRGIGSGIWIEGNQDS
jgi:hypothetical protein